jgi:hypothetical protein
LPLQRTITDLISYYLSVPRSTAWAREAQGVDVLGWWRVPIVFLREKKLLCLLITGTEDPQYLLGT